MTAMRGLQLGLRGALSERVHPGEESQRHRQWTGSAAAPWAAVAAAVTWSLWELRATLTAVQYGDDGPLHEQMVRFATERIRSGHDPLTSWFPYLGLGSPQFMHYQSTPAILTGLAGLVMGPDTAYRWSLYLLWCLWPVAIYISGRLFGLGRWAAALAAVVAPLLHSVPGVGYEQYAYVWTGYGVWTQLWGSWALPFAWAFCWRALADKRFTAPAAALVALTAAFHYETGYLAFLAVVIMPFVVWRDIWARLLRAAAVLAAALLASAWVVVPLLQYARWAAVNQALAGSYKADGYGARVTLGWLVTGRLFDDDHLPVVSLLVAAGLLVALIRWRRAGPGRALMVLMCACLVLSFGPVAFGGLARIIPGSTDLFFRRFLMGPQLAGIFLAGLGGCELARLSGRLARACGRFLARKRLGRLSWAPGVVLAAAAVAGLIPVWSYFDNQDTLNATAIHAQQIAQRDWQPQIAALTAYLRRHPGGRVYAGSFSNAGEDFRVGYIPMYAYLESLDLDQVGNALRTASLMSQPEYHFDTGNLGDYALFGVRYVILPAKTAPPRGAILVLHTSQMRVFDLPSSSYIRVVNTVGNITENRADIGSQTIAYLRSSLPGQDRYFNVAYSGAPAAPPTQRSDDRLAGPPGTVMADHADLAGGSASTVVRMNRTGVVVLSASFDPGWAVTVDGRPAAPQMITPALVGVTVPPGTHHITFRYSGFGGYPELFAIAVADLLAVALITLHRPARARARRTQAEGNKAVTEPENPHVTTWE